MINKQLEKCVSIDIETTGVNPGENAIIEIGATLWSGGDRFFVECFMPSGTVYHPRALEVNGHTEGELKARNWRKYMSQHEACHSLLNFCESHGVTVMIGKNPDFDRKFLLHFSGLGDRVFPLSYRTIDYGSMATLQMLRDGLAVPEKGFSSDQIAEYFGIPEEEKPHNALRGAIHNQIALDKILKED